MNSDFDVETIHTSDPKTVTLDKRPLVLRGLSLGPCTHLWNNIDYLKSRVAVDKRVSVHVCPHGKMNFLEKNFLYKTMPFHVLLDRCTHNGKLPEYFICEQEKYYLRALGDNPRKEAAFFEKHFPDLAADVCVPELFPKERMFSSVFRAGSAGVRLWTHYDVMDNILMQIVGRKSVVLFDPLDAPYVYMIGDKSEVIDVDEPDLTRYPLFAKAKRYRAHLLPGDVLYIPALWFHNVVSDDFSLAVNVFWRSSVIPLETYDGKDVYGNSDLLPAQRAFQGVDRAIKQLDSLPDEYRQFYAFRCIEMIRKKFGWSREAAAFSGADVNDQAKAESNCASICSQTPARLDSSQSTLVTRADAVDDDLSPCSVAEKKSDSMSN